MGSKPTRRLDYAILKFTSSAPALDYTIVKLCRRHTHDIYPKYIYTLYIYCCHDADVMTSLQRNSLNWPVQGDHQRFGYNNTNKYSL